MNEKEIDFHNRLVGHSLEEFGKRCYKLGISVEGLLTEKKLDKIKVSLEANFGFYTKNMLEAVLDYSRKEDFERRGNSLW